MAVALEEPKQIKTCRSYTGGSGDGESRERGRRSSQCVGEGAVVGGGDIEEGSGMGLILFFYLIFRKFWIKVRFHIVFYGNER